MYIFLNQRATVQFSCSVVSESLRPHGLQHLLFADMAGNIFIHTTKDFIQDSVSVQSLSRVQLFVTPWIAACQASLSITNSWSLLKLMSIKLVMPSSHLILCRRLLLLPLIPPSIRVFSNESALSMRWPKYWSFSFSISPSKERPGLICFRMDLGCILTVNFCLYINLQGNVYVFEKKKL